MGGAREILKGKKGPLLSQKKRGETGSPVSPLSKINLQSNQV
jgi:hypothetical protein